MEYGRMSVQQSVPQKQKPKRKPISRRLRVIATIIIVLTVALAIAAAQILSSAKLIPDIWATISNAVVAVLGATFAFFALIPLLFPPDNPQPAPVAPPPSQPTIPPSPPSHPGGEPAAERPGTVWTVPYSRNPFFTGRERLLTLLHDNLTTTKAAVLTQAQAISGLGGIGKTQTAVEYAHRYRDEYRFVLWASATTRETLIADFVTLADVLDLPEKNEQDQNITVAAVKRWLAQHDGWLLILDNADDLSMARDYGLRTHRRQGAHLTHNSRTGGGSDGQEHRGGKNGPGRGDQALAPSCQYACSGCFARPGS
jgi:hypothetical protein